MQFTKLCSSLFLEGDAFKDASYRGQRFAVLAKHLNLVDHYSVVRLCSESELADKSLALGLLLRGVFLPLSTVHLTQPYTRRLNYSPSAQLHPHVFLTGDVVVVVVVFFAVAVQQHKRRIWRECELEFAAFLNATYGVGGLRGFRKGELAAIASELNCLLHLFIIRAWSFDFD